jgi:hypothetical protein
MKQKVLCSEKLGWAGSNEGFETVPGVNYYFLTW